MDADSGFFLGPLNGGATETSIRLSDIYPAAAAPDPDITLADVPKVDENLMRRIHGGEIPRDQIDPEAYARLGKYYTQALDEALSKVPGRDYDRNGVRFALEDNVWAFSGSKLFHQQRAMSRHLVDENGEPRTYEQFRNRVIADGEVFNDHHLRTEYNNAVRTARAAEKWQHLAKYSALEYRTVGDERVRKTHQTLHGKVFATDDPIWREIYPPNGWGCRCTVIPAHGKTPDAKSEEVEMSVQDVPRYFRKNAGQELKGFFDDHPIVEVARREWAQVLRAVEHYGLQSKKSIYKKHQLPDVPMGADEDAAPETATTYDGLTVEVAPDLRPRDAHLAGTVLKSPDEVWSRRIGKDVIRAYIKWYSGNPLEVKVATEKGRTRVVGVRKLTDKQVDAARRGVLIHYTDLSINQPPKP